MAIFNVTKLLKILFDSSRNNFRSGCKSESLSANVNMLKIVRVKCSHLTDSISLSSLITTLLLAPSPFNPIVWCRCLWQGNWTSKTCFACHYFLATNIFSNIQVFCFTFLKKFTNIFTFRKLKVATNGVIDNKMLLNTASSLFSLGGNFQGNP